jgi:hypothetical protein
MKSKCDKSTNHVMDYYNLCYIMNLKKKQNKKTLVKCVRKALRVLLRIVRNALSTRRAFGC